MRVDASSGNAQPTPAVPAGIGAPPSKEEFLRLLVAQIENQDPLAPTDNAQFVAQLAQFASLEQIANTNAQLAAMEAQQATATGTSRANMVGRNVTASAARFHVTRDGYSSPPLQVKLGQPAADVQIIVRNADGQELRRLDLGPTPAGNTSVAWDGRMANGGALPDGDYTIEVTASDAAGGVIKAAPFFIGPLEAVDFWGGIPHLRFGSFSVTPADVVTIGQ